jgi:hypothetical protein
MGHEAISRIVQQAQGSENEATRESAAWASTVIVQLMAE